MASCTVFKSALTASCQPRTPSAQRSRHNTAALGQQSHELLSVILRRWAGVIVKQAPNARIVERWFVQRQLRDGKVASRRIEGKDCAGRHAEHESRSTCFFNEGFEIFDLTLDRIRLRVPAVASSPAIVVEYAEVLRQ